MPYRIILNCHTYETSNATNLLSLMRFKPLKKYRYHQSRCKVCNNMASIIMIEKVDTITLLGDIING